MVVSDVNDNAPVCPVKPDIQLDRSAQPGQLVDSLEVSIQVIGSMHVRSIYNVRTEGLKVDHPKDFMTEELSRNEYHGGNCDMIIFSSIFHFCV